MKKTKNDIQNEKQDKSGRKVVIVSPETEGMTVSAGDAEKTEAAGEKDPEGKAVKGPKKRHPVIKLIVALVILALMVGALGTALVLTNHQLSKLAAQMDYMQDTLTVVNSNVGNMETNIEATLEEQNSLLENCGVTLTAINFKDSVYSVRVDIVPKEYTETTLCSVYFGTTEVPLELEGIYYTGTAALPISESYAQNLTVVFTDGDRRTTEIVSSYKGIDLENVDYVNVAQGFTPVCEDGKLTGKGSAEITVYGQDIFSFDSIQYEVCLDGKAAYEMDVLRGTAENLMVQTATGEEGAKGEDDADLSELANGEALPAEGGAGDSSLTGEDVAFDEEEADDREDEETLDTETETEETEQEEAVLTEVDPVTIISGNYDVNFEIPIEKECTVSIVLRARTTEGYEIVYEIYNGTIMGQTASEEDAEQEDQETVADYALTESPAFRQVTFYDLLGGSFSKTIE